MSIGIVYLKSIKKEFLHYKQLAEKAMEQLEPAQLFFVNKDEANSIATIINHLNGNMLSRWTDFLTTDGEKSWRNRDNEFNNNATDKETVLAKWEEGWSCLFNSINQLDETQLETIVFIRNEPHTVVDAINRQLAHYSYHIGQIVYSAKQLKNSEWYSLSINRNRSDEYNSAKFLNKNKPIDGLDW